MEPFFYFFYFFFQLNLFVFFGQLGSFTSLFVIFSLLENSFLNLQFLVFVVTIHYRNNFNTVKGQVVINVIKELLRK
jgi:hypothetical protein